jgi:hypothetical protein
MRPMGTVSQPSKLPGQIPRHPPVHCRTVHAQPGGYLDNLSAIQDRPDRVQALLHH